MKEVEKDNAEKILWLHLFASACEFTLNRIKTERKRSGKIFSCSKIIELVMTYKNLIWNSLQ